MPPMPTSLSMGSQDFTPAGFPHSDTCGSTLFWQLTALFRGLSVFLRQHVPRHPSRALSRLSSTGLSPDPCEPFLKPVSLLLFAYSQISEASPSHDDNTQNVFRFLFAFLLLSLFFARPCRPQASRLVNDKIFLSN